MPSTRRSKRKNKEEEPVAQEVNVDEEIELLPETKQGADAPRLPGMMGPKPNRKKMIPVYPTPATCAPTSEASSSIVLPDFHDLINYEYCLQRVCKEGTRNCVMCGLARQVLTTKKECENNEPYILVHNAGVCSVCQDAVWKMAWNNKVELKFCFVCNSFKPWGDFRKIKDSDRMVKSCRSCRANQKKPHQPREKKQKVEKKRDESAGCLMVPQQPVMPPSSSAEGEESITLPEFANIVNYPNYLHHKFGKKKCVLCGTWLDYFQSKKGHKDAGHCIFARNCGICNVCDTKVWKLKSNNALIKWCGGCNHFRLWTEFRGEKNSVMKRCSHCQQTVHNYTKKKLASAVAKADDGFAVVPAPAS